MLNCFDILALSVNNATMVERTMFPVQKTVLLVLMTSRFGQAITIVCVAPAVPFLI